jgi:hypothetical protein
MHRDETRNRRQLGGLNLRQAVGAGMWGTDMKLCVCVCVCVVGVCVCVFSGV